MGIEKKLISIGEALFEIDEKKYLYIPKNKLALTIQQNLFNLFIEMQSNFIENYNNYEDKIKESNRLSSFFVNAFLNGDGVTFKFLLGFMSKGPMTKFELEKVKIDFNEMKIKMENNEIKCFFMLDLIPMSNRRADCIIVTNELNIELYDVSLGVIADKLKNISDISGLSNKEIEQYERKRKQNIRIDSYKSKIFENTPKIENVITDSSELTIEFFCAESDFFDLNFSVDYLKKSGENCLYIPKSVCFLFYPNYVSESFIRFPLKHNIDNPFSSVKWKPKILDENLKYIYESNLYIGVSLIYLHLIFGYLCPIELQIGKAIPSTKPFTQIHIKVNNKKRGLYFFDKRTKQKIPFSMGILAKHIFSNISVENWVQYISKLLNYNNKDEDFHKSAFPHDKIMESPYSFFCSKSIRKTNI